MKYSRQREALLDCIKNRQDHPSAYALFESLKKDDPKLSLGTVYRNLALLSDLGEIKKITSKDGSERYDPLIEPHNHFVCNECGRIIDIPRINEDGIYDKAKHDDIATVNTYELSFYGICKECYKK